MSDAGVGSLLGGLPFDATTVVQRVVQQFVGQMLADGAFSGAEGSSPEDVIAGAVGNWLSQTIRAGHSVMPHGPAIEATARDVDLAVDVDGVVARNSELAAAVGACDCWGDDTGCPYCEGLGVAGWLPPDRRLFAVYVYPAVRALRGGGQPRRRPAR